MGKYNIWLTKTMSSDPGSTPGIIMSRPSASDVFIKKVGDASSNMTQIRNVSCFGIDPTSSSFKNSFPAGMQSIITAHTNKSSHSIASNISYISGNNTNIDNGTTIYGPFTV